MRRSTLSKPHTRASNEGDTCMGHRKFGWFAAASVLAFGMSPAAWAGTLTIDALVGGAPTGANYVNFENLSLGSAGGTSNGVSVSFAGDGGVVQGSSSGVNAPPY